MACKLNILPLRRNANFKKGNTHMRSKTYQALLTEREANMIFNRGLRAAVFVLEMEEWLSPERRRHFLESLKKKIAEREEYYKLKLIESIDDGFR